MDGLLREYINEGWVVVFDNDDAEVEIRKVLPRGVLEVERPFSPRLRTVLKQYDLGGILHISMSPGDGKPHERVIVTQLSPDDGSDVLESDADD